MWRQTKPAWRRTQIVPHCRFEPFHALGRSRTRAFTPRRRQPLLREKTIDSGFVRGKSKFPQANPSSAKLIQIKMLGFAWFYSSETGLFNGLQRFQIKIFLPYSVYGPGKRLTGVLPPATGCAGGISHNPRRSFAAVRTNSERNHSVCQENCRVFRCTPIRLGASLSLTDC